MDPAGKTVIITGASGGIGTAAARAFAAGGANVVLAARSGDALEHLARELPGRPLVIPTDVSIPTEAQALIERVTAERGQADILINNAGIGLVGAVATLDPADLERVMAVNVLGALYTIQAVVPAMRQRRSGQIINISSVLAVQSLPGTGGYATSKAALESLTSTLRMELLDSGIAVTLVRPSTTRTEFFKKRLGRPGGNAPEQRLWRPRSVPPEAVARALLRAAHREPRVAYASVFDSIQMSIIQLFPDLVQHILAKIMVGEQEA